MKTRPHRLEPFGRERAQPVAMQTDADRSPNLVTLRQASEAPRPRLVPPPAAVTPRDLMVGDHPSMRAVFDLVERVAPTRASVLITGESGTGKELVTEALHRLSPRRTAALVKVCCSALAESVLESELFGHDRGAFTGATDRRDGRFSEADGGSLYLDEIGEIPPRLQVKLLRFLQEREFQRVGTNRTERVDVRFIASTNRDLEREIHAGNFREDLFYRLNVVRIEMPPLRERGSDLAGLTRRFVRGFASEYAKPVEGLSREAMDLLVRHDWPGNVRELEHVIERAVILARGTRIEVGDLPDSIRGAKPNGTRIPGSTLEEIERHAILATLEREGGSTARAARVLGISRRTIQYRLCEYRRSGTL